MLRCVWRIQENTEAMRNVRAGCQKCGGMQYSLQKSCLDIIHMCIYIYIYIHINSMYTYIRTIDNLMVKASTAWQTPTLQQQKQQMC